MAANLATAYHEAGHAVIALTLGRNVQRVSILPNQLRLGQCELKIEEQAPDIATPILCYCGGGSRSALAAESLQRMGYTNVASVIGGFKAWKEQGLPTTS